MKKNTYNQNQVKTQNNGSEKIAETLEAKTGNRGFTLIELLVVISTAPILIALLLPAVQ